MNKKKTLIQHICETKGTPAFHEKNSSQKPFNGKHSYVISTSNSIGVG